MEFAGGLARMSCFGWMIICQDSSSVYICAPIVVSRVTSLIEISVRISLRQTVG